MGASLRTPLIIVIVDA